MIFDETFSVLSNIILDQIEDVSAAATLFGHRVAYITPTTTVD
jgi:hypothetical protein